MEDYSIAINLLESAHLILSSIRRVIINNNDFHVNVAILFKKPKLLLFISSLKEEPDDEGEVFAFVVGGEEDGVLGVVHGLSIFRIKNLLITHIF